MNSDNLLKVAIDFGLMSGLLVVGHLLRSKVRLLQATFVPTPIIAGFLGLIGGRQVLDWIPFSRIDGRGDGLGTLSFYPGLLVVVLFATLFMGHRARSRTSVRTVTRKVGDTFFYNLASLVGMYGLALLFGVLVLDRLFPDLHRGFALMLPAGFVGGHGTATAVAGSLADRARWPEAEVIGYTFATVGLLSAIFGGMVLINVATRRGWTRVVRPDSGVSDIIGRGFIPPGRRSSLGEETVNPLALDPLTWHVALVMIAFALAFAVKSLAARVLPDDFVLPAFCLALLAGALIQALLDAVRVGQYVDRRIMTRIGSSVSDYLIAFGVASIQITVVIDYALPLVIMSLFGIAFSVGLFWFVGRRVFRNFWFERSVFVYGWNTGVVGMGVMLLRIVDPKMKTPTLPDFGLAYLFVAVAELAVITGLPVLVARGIVTVPALLLTAGCVACVVLSRYLVGWFRDPPDRLREGEQEIVSQ